MSVEVVEQELSAEALRDYAAVPISFLVESILRVTSVDGGLGGFELHEETVEPFIKDYDFDASDPNDGPVRWLRWKTAASCILVAQEEGRRLGSAVVLTHQEGMEFLRRRLDTAALWDLRVRPESRGHGIGTALFEAAAAWSRKHGYKRLKIETQNINVGACRFYVAMGCYLGGIERHAYEDFPDEIELIWYRDID